MIHQWVKESLNVNLNSFAGKGGTPHPGLVKPPAGVGRITLIERLEGAHPRNVRIYDHRELVSQSPVLPKCGTSGERTAEVE